MFAKLNILFRNCEHLDILVHKEPVSRRNNAKLRVDQLKYDYQHLQVNTIFVKQFLISIKFKMYKYILVRIKNTSTKSAEEIES